MRTLKNGPVVRNRLRLPHPVDTSQRIAVICAPDSRHAQAARAAGAALVGEDSIFAAVKDGRIEFDRCMCHSESLVKLNQAGLGRVLGPKGLMPSTKQGTVVKDVAGSVRDMVGGSEYRERTGVVRMAVGQLGFTPNDLSRNVKAFIGALKRDCGVLSDRITKEIHEVVSFGGCSSQWQRTSLRLTVANLFGLLQVLSSTCSPGFSLNGDFKSVSSPPTSALSTL